MKNKPKSEKLNREEILLSRIEEAREKIHNMIGLNKKIILNDEIINLSQKLDLLIVEYVKISRGEPSSEKDR